MKPGVTGRCPHCKVGVRFEATAIMSSAAANYGTIEPLCVLTQSNWLAVISTSGCPECGRPIVFLDYQRKGDGSTLAMDLILWPVSSDRIPPPEVEAAAPSLANDYREAAAVLGTSPKASAALSRRCLQSVLRDKGGARKRDLADQIDEVLLTLPTEIGANVDAIRTIGNFAAHPMKSAGSGEILDVEDGEAEWLLNVLEELFDYYYVAPLQAAAKRAALNAKLAAAGKLPLKAPPPAS